MTDLDPTAVPRPPVPAAARSPLLVRSAPSWPDGVRAAVSLCYDDGLACHVRETAPLLEERDLRATFYVPIATTYDDVLSTLQTDPEGWGRLAAAGHELGNHSVFHPCRKDDLKFWLDDRYDLCNYTLEQWRHELDLANFALALVDGGEPTDRTFGNTCCEVTVGSGDHEEPMEPVLRERFVCGRGPWTDALHKPGDLLPRWQLGHWSGDGKSAAELRGEVEAARDEGCWLIYMFHGVGKSTHPFLWVDDGEHRDFLEWMSVQEDLLVAPVRNVARTLFEDGVDHLRYPRTTLA